MIANKENEPSFFLPLKIKNNSDFLSPYKISVIFLLQEYLKTKSTTPQSLTEDDDKLGKLDINFPPDYKRKFCMLLLKLIQYPDMNYKDLYNLITSDKYRLHEQHLEGFKDVMNVLSKRGIDILFKLAKLMDDLIIETSTSGTNGVVSQYGVVGLYFRRVLVTLDKMSFQELMNLYKNINIYYEKGIRALTIAPNPQTSISDIEDTILNKHSKWSVKQAELFVAQQSALLENDETKALKPKEMQKRLDEIIQVYNPLYSQAYFLTYMNNIRVRDLPNCIEALHCSFDRNAGKYGHTHTDNNFSKSSFQYSILNLAIMHTLFDHKEVALKCLKECIMTAQESGDRVCLQLAQLWLCLLDKSNFQLSEKNIANKTELSLVHSVSLNIQSLVKVAAISGYLPSKLFDLLIKSDILNCQHSMMNLISNCIAERAALWTLYGKIEVASLCSQLLLNSHLKSLNKTHNGEGLCQALCNLAMWLSLQGDYTSSSLLLHNAKEKFPRFPISRNWLLCEYFITSQQSIHWEKWTEASNACCHLYHLEKNLSMLQRANLNIIKGNHILAQSILYELLSQNEEELDPLLRVRAMILQAQSLIDANYCPPESLIILNRAAILANDKYLDYEHSIIQMNISYILLQMNMPQEALKAIKLNLENILSNGGIYDKAKAIFLFVQCLIASLPDKESKLEKLQESSDQVELAISYFTKLECYTKVKNIYSYLAKFYNQHGLIEERNRYALKFRLLAEEFTNNTNDNLNIFH